MSDHNQVKEFLEVLSEFSAIKKISDGKKIKYMLPNLLDDIPDLEKIRKLTKPSEIKISNSDDHEIILIF